VKPTLRCGRKKGFI